MKLCYVDLYTFIIGTYNFIKKLRKSVYRIPGASDVRNRISTIAI